MNGKKLDDGVNSWTDQGCMGMNTTVGQIEGDMAGEIMGQIEDDKAWVNSRTD